MHSISRRLSVLLFGVILGLYILLIMVSVFYMDDLIERDSVSNLTMMVGEKSRELNQMFDCVERAVMAVHDHVIEITDMERMRTDSEYAEELEEELSEYIINVAKITGDVLTAYYRPNPEIYGSTAGLLLSADGYGGYIHMAPTDILQYDKTDRQHVGWYYEPLECGRAMWMEPYYNINIKTYIISYVTPLYKNGEILGVVGMDIDMKKLHAITDQGEFTDGWGYLLNTEGDILYHKDYPGGLLKEAFDEELQAASGYFSADWARSDRVAQFTYEGEKQYFVSDELINGMIVGLSVPEAEFTAPRTFMFRNMIVVFSIVMIVILATQWWVTLRIKRPIKELTTAAIRISKGELNTTIAYESKDEIGELANSIRMMSGEIKEYISYIHSQAYTDVMTGVGNKASYMDNIKILERKMIEGMADFSVIVFDVNGLKLTNDTLGHEYGDLLIVDAANVIKSVFGTEHVYRIGGDEFIVVLENVHKEDLDNYFRHYREMIAVVNMKERKIKKEMSISFGMAKYNPETDKFYRDVFRRADMEMYRNKEVFYQGKNDRRRAKRD